MPSNLEKGVAKILAGKISDYIDEAKKHPIDLEATYAPLSESKILDVGMLIKEIIKLRINELGLERSASLEIDYQEEANTEMVRKISVNDYSPIRIFIDTDNLMPKFTSRSNILNEKMTVLVN